MKKRTARLEFEYMTHIENLKDILERGILSHNEVEKQGLKPLKISDPQIVGNRNDIKTPSGNSLWDYANVYFRARNAMLYRIVRNFKHSDIVIITVLPTITKLPNTFITNGNAASGSTQFFETPKLKEVLNSLKPEIEWEWWKKGDGSISKMMAECLVKDKIPTDHLKAIYVSNHETKEKIERKYESLLTSLDIQVISDPDLFYQSSTRSQINENFDIVDGDMIFSGMQTLTISVNTEGHMGKGLASRVRYQFPDVYVYYEDLCKKRILKMGQPNLFTRGENLIDAPNSVNNKEELTWFLLFPTKNNFRFKSDLKGIEKGLIWLKKNYLRLGIKSIALPALGCGLGWLSWKDVGPIMAKHLNEFKIPVRIYLPREKKIDDKYLTKEFLLGSQT